MYKVAVIGAGQVGQATVHMLARENFCREIILLSRDENAARGVAMDIQHAIPLYESNANVRGTNDYRELDGAQVVVITAGLTRQPGMSRLDLLESNRSIMESVVNKIIKYAPEAYIILVSNPVDILTYCTWQQTGWDKNRIMGLSCILDSARMSSFIGQKTGYSVREISSLVIGGHGDSMVPLPRFSRINGVPIDVFLSEEEINDVISKTRTAGGDIVQLKGTSGYVAAAASVVTMVDAVVNDRNHILPCVSILNGEYGLHDIALGVPTVLGGSGVTRVIELPLNEEEQEALRLSAVEIQSKIDQL